jgi:4-aminobutyrate--pyruvate transaminase
MTATPNSPEARDIASLLHPYTNLARHGEIGPHVFTHGKGIYVYDTQGKAYIEGLSGLWCTSLGYGEEALVEAAAEQMRALSFAPIFSHRSHEPAIDLAEKLIGLIPAPVSKIFFAGSGSGANDTAIKLIWYYNNALGRPQKKKLISRTKAYHGVTVATASLTGLPANHTDFDLPIERVLHTDCPHYYRFAWPGESEEDFATRLAENLEELILAEGPETVAAFFAEPVMGAGGVLIPPKSYFAKIQAVLRRYDVLFVADEVICGFGRTGNLFGFETYGIAPDMISMAKQLSSGYLPIGALSVPPAMFEAMVSQSEKIGTFGHGNTYSAHPVCAAVALKTLEIMAERDILGHVRAVAPQFQARLGALADHPLVGEARGVGLIGALELVADKTTRAPFAPDQAVGAQAVERARENGLLCRAMGDAVALCPPLIITREQIDDLFDRLARALDALAASL